jgi:hypothetical protein
MAQQESISGTTAGCEEAIVCTLDSAGFATQAARWTQVLARGAIDYVEIEGGIRVQFRAEPGVEQELRELVAVESECCSWAAWVVDIREDRLALRVTSTGDGVTVIRTMFESVTCDRQ